MSRSCAKPTCSAAAERWFDFMPNEQRVIERVQATDLAVALCGAHAGRLSVPAGWTLDLRAGDVSHDEVEPAATPDDGPSGDSSTEETTVHRSYSRDAPWFLALSDEPAAEGAEPSEAAPVLDREPSAGSLLHRAFHGPDRESDIERARHDAAPHQALDELTPRRVKRSSNGYDSVQLPFPPVDEPESHVAVS